MTPDTMDLIAHGFTLAALLFALVLLLAAFYGGTVDGAVAGTLDAEAEKHGWPRWTPETETVPGPDLTDHEQALAEFDQRLSDTPSTAHSEGDDVGAGGDVGRAA